VGKGEAGAASRLLNQGHIPKGAENRIHGIFDRKNETSGKLSPGKACIHKGRRIGKKIEGEHHTQERICRLLDLSGPGIPAFDLGDCPSDTRKHCLGSLQGIPLAVDKQDSLSEDLASNIAQVIGF
jgi:hypothetical protein